MGAEPDTPLDLFVDGYAQPRRETLGPGAMLLRAFASPRAAALLAALEEVAQRSPFRFMTTPGGYRMSVAMTNCGAAGWVTDRSGYRYDALDPLAHADVVVWGGPARLRFHGVQPLKDGWHPALGACRVNLSLRKAR